jgi:hypothetical protein
MIGRRSELGSFDACRLNQAAPRSGFGAYELLGRQLNSAVAKDIELVAV